MFNKTVRSDATKIKMLCMAAIFCALAFVSTFVFRFKVMFLTFDIKDALVTLAGLLFGPVYSVSISIIVALLEFVTRGDTGFWGLFMDVLSTATFSTVAALIYKYKKNITGALIGLLSSVFAMTAVMLLFNIFITPIYMETTRTEVIALFPSLFLPFNIVKGIMNSAIVMILYKPISKALKSARVLPSKVVSNETITAEEKKRKNLIFSLVVTLVSVAVIALCVAIFVVFMNGSFEFI